MLTAAHCVVNINTGNVKDPGSVQVLVGAHDTTDSNVDRRDVSTIRTHPDFNNTRGQYDAAVLFLNFTLTLTFSSTVAPICLPASVQSLYTDQTATVTGWGLIGASGDTSTTLQEVEVTVASNEDCKDTYPGKIEE